MEFLYGGEMQKANKPAKAILDVKVKIGKGETFSREIAKKAAEKLYEKEIKFLTENSYFFGSETFLMVFHFHTKNEVFHIGFQRKTKNF